MMIRSFLPVGQGAFYCEQFRVIDSKPINVVYDCGSFRNTKLVKKEIENNFEEKEVIHALFVSHLHDDHINGIAHLVKHCEVKKIFLPLLTEKNRALLELSCSINGDNQAIAFIRNPEMALRTWNPNSPVPQIYQIREYSSEDTIEVEGRQRNLDEERDNSNNERESTVIDSGTNVINHILGESDIKLRPYSNWSYIPFNFRQEERVAILKKELSSIYKRSINNDDIVNMWKSGSATDRKKIKGAYKKIPDNFNTNSMTLFSGLNYSARNQWLINTKRNCHCCGRCDMGRRTEVGCLYTGDYNAGGNANWEQLRNAYRNYWNLIGCVQIPHHGSKHNYNSKLAEQDAFFIISAGYNNSFRHPHNLVIKDLLFHRHYPYIVTEEIRSAVHLYIDFMIMKAETD